MTDLRLTEHAGDEERLAHQAMDDGVHTLVVCGGDGTWGKVAGAVVGGSSPGTDLPTGASAAPPVRLAFLSAGTGNDFAKNLRAPTSDPAAMARMISEGALEQLVDMGRVDDRLFLNVAGFGFDVAVLRSSDGGRWLRGPALYVATAMQELFSFEGIECRVCLDASDLLAPWTRRLLMVFANGAHFGGAFRVAPDAVWTTARWMRSSWVTPRAGAARRCWGACCTALIWPMRTCSMRRENASPWPFASRRGSRRTATCTAQRCPNARST